MLILCLRLLVLLYGVHYLRRTRLRRRPLHILTPPAPNALCPSNRRARNRLFGPYTMCHPFPACSQPVRSLIKQCKKINDFRRDIVSFLTNQQQQFTLYPNYHIVSFQSLNYHISLKLTIININNSISN